MGVFYCLSNKSILNDIEDVKKSVDEEIEDYYELIGVRKNCTE